MEDDPRDAELVRHELRAGGIAFQLECVDNEPDFFRLLTDFRPDVILSDFALPTFDGYSALQLASARCPDSPFIFVSGTMGEEIAIETLKKGATDYVLKHRLSRLVPSVLRALRESHERKERRRAEEQLRDSHRQLRTLSVHLQHVREEERTRIAREVHDELGQALTGLKLQLIWLISRLPKKLRALHKKARIMAEYIDQTIQSVRRIATELRPGVLDNAGLAAALEWQANEFSRQTAIPCRVRAPIRESNYSQELNTAFFRIFQEILTNVIRHAGAKKVEVRLMDENDCLVLEVCDNGRGITDAEIRNTKSIGLLGIRERASLLGGKVQFAGVPGTGTTVTVRIPRPSRRSTNENENSAYRRPRRRATGAEAHSR